MLDNHGTTHDITAHNTIERYMARVVNNEVLEKYRIPFSV